MKCSYLYYFQNDFKKTGSNLMGMMNHIQKPVTKTTEPSAPKKKMKGPSINLDDLED